MNYHGCKIVPFCTGYAILKDGLYVDQAANLAQAKWLIDKFHNI